MCLYCLLLRDSAGNFGIFPGRCQWLSSFYGAIVSENGALNKVAKLMLVKASTSISEKLQKPLG